MVVLHGLFGSARNLTGLTRALSMGHRVIAMDLRNHGESGHDPVAGYGEMAADVVATLDAQDVRSAALVGHSMGGKVAMRLALEWPGRVSRLVVADIAPVPYPSHFGAFVQAMLRVPATASRGEADAVLAPDVVDPAVRGFLLHNFRPGLGWRVGLAEIAVNLGQIETWNDCGEPFCGPTLFVTGARSDYVLPEHRPVITRLFPAARFEAVADAGHWLHAEQPALFNAIVDRFLAET